MSDKRTLEPTFLREYDIRGIIGSKFNIKYNGLTKIQKLKNITECLKLIFSINKIMLS